jgi:hypothetical protein
MKSTKAIGLIVLVLASTAGLSLATLSSVDATPRFLKQLKLMYTTDLVLWSHIPGNQISDFKLKLDPAVEWYYIDIMSLKPMTPINDGSYEFYVADTVLPAEFLAFWDAKGVNALATPGTWEAYMWDIINGDAPIFYLEVVGTDYMLVDGLLRGYFNAETNLRVNGDYPLGTYAYTGDIMGNTVEMQITFK